MLKDGYDHADILACLAPKPVLLLTADSDFFPIEGMERTVKKARPLWGIFSKEDALEVRTDSATHGYSFNMANWAADFFSRVLKGSTSAPLESIEVGSHCDLYATETGSVVKSLNSKIINDFVKDELKEIDLYNERMTHAGRRLRAEQFIEGWVNGYSPYPLYIKQTYKTIDVLNLTLELYAWYQQEGLLNFGGMLKLPGTRPDTVVVAVWGGGLSKLHDHLDKIMEYCEKGCGVFVLELIGTGSLGRGLYNDQEPDYFFTKFTNLANNLLVNGDYVPAMRVRGICRGISAVEAITGGDTKVGVYTHGKYNLYGLMARLIDSRISFIDEDAPLNGVRGYAENKYYNKNNIMSLVMPGMLKYFDIEDLRGFIHK